MSSGIASGGVRNIPPDSPVIINASVSTGSTTNVYTVPAGRKLYIDGALFSPGAPTNARILLDSSIVVRCDNITIATPLYGSPLLVATAGQVIACSTVGGASSCSFNLWGYLL